MNNSQLIAILIGQLALIAKDEALGYRGQAITEALALLSTLITRGQEAQAELEALAAHIASMVAVNREPTKAEWYAFRDLSRQYNEVFNPPSVAEDEVPKTESK